MKSRLDDIAKRMSMKEIRESARLLDSVHIAEKELDKDYSKWSTEEKIQFILNRSVKGLDEQINKITKQLDHSLQIYQKAHEQVGPSALDRKIQELEKLGFMVIYENEQETNYNRFTDPSLTFETNAYRKSEFYQGEYYKDIYFLHKEKAILLAYEYLLFEGGYDKLFDFGGYFEINYDNDPMNLDHSFCFSNSYEFENYPDILGITLEKRNTPAVAKALVLLKNGLISDQMRPLPIDSFGYLKASSWLAYVMIIDEYWDDLYQHLPSNVQKCFYSTKDKTYGKCIRRK